MYSGTTFTETDKKKLCPNYQPQKENIATKESKETCPINPNDVPVEVLRECQVFLKNGLLTLSEPARALFLSLGLSELLEEKHAHTSHD